MQFADNPPLWEIKGSFLSCKLPTEIQDVILHFALSSASDLSKFKNEKTIEESIGFNILKANHQLSAQAIPIFYACNTFRIVINPNHEDFALKEENLPAWILDPTPHQLAYIRKIHMEVVSDCCVVSRSMERFIRVVLRALEKFSKMASMLQSCIGSIERCPNA